MLVRALRVTDRVGNALLRVMVWASLAAVQQATAWRRALVGIIMAVVLAVAGAVGLVIGVGRRTTRTAQQAYEVTQDASARRRQERMVQKAAVEETRVAYAEDPLRAQNRALSALVVLLLLILLAFVVWQTWPDKQDEFTAGAGAGWPQGGAAPPTVIFPTPPPTATAVPDPLREAGSLAFALRENGQEDIWAISVGESGPLRLTNSPADERDPAWSPDGTRLAFASNRDGNWELYILSIETGITTRLTYTPGFEGAPTWSPDGAYLAYEGYANETQDLDLYIISSDPARAAEEGAFRATSTTGPDTEPDWAPDGRHIAFTSWRSGSQDIYILNLDSEGGDGRAVNLTNTPDIDEDCAAWSHDGQTVAYTATVNGVEGVYVKRVSDPSAAPELVGRGRMPAWAPNDGSVAYLLDVGRPETHTQILTGSIGGFGAATDAVALTARASDPHWTAAALPLPLVESGGAPPAPDADAPLYVERVQPRESGLYGLAPLNNITAPQPYLSDRVNDSFEALRLRVMEKTGRDFLGALEDAFWHQDRPPEPGQPRQNWHYTGRAAALDRNLVYSGALEVVREDREINTYWRVFLRVADDAQIGALGEPLRAYPWDVAARSSGDVTDYERGGRVKSAIPPGYYVDLTQLAEDFGWGRLPSGGTWQRDFSALQYWELVKTDGLTWEAAMRELYTPEELEGFLSAGSGAPAPAPLPTPSPTPELYRTPTPIPPDQQ